MKEGGSNTPTALRTSEGHRSAQVVHGIDDSTEAGRAATNPMREDRDNSARPSRKGERRERDAKLAGRVGSKPSTSPKTSDKGVDAMVRVRQDFRQPVTSLWQTATERAATAPTRLMTSTSTNTGTGRDLSRRRPCSQASAMKARGGGLSTLSMCAANNTTNEIDQVKDEHQHVGGKGATVSGAGGRSRGNNRRRMSKEGELTNSKTTKNAGSAVSVYGSGGQAIDGDPGGRKTPIPLRSSHRVGPVGSLGEQGGGAFLRCE